MSPTTPRPSWCLRALYGGSMHSLKVWGHSAAWSASRTSRLFMYRSTSAWPCGNSADDRTNSRASYCSVLRDPLTPLEAMTVSSRSQHTLLKNFFCDSFRWHSFSTPSKDAAWLESMSPRPCAMAVTPYWGEDGGAV